MRQMNAGLILAGRDPVDMVTRAQQIPQNAMQMQAQQMQMGAFKQEQMEANIAKLARGVVSAQDRPGAYKAALMAAERMGIPTTGLPREYTEDVGAMLEAVAVMGPMGKDERTEFERLLSTMDPEEAKRAIRVRAGLAPRAATPNDPIAGLRARAEAAGLAPGTPAYAEFMRSGGKVEDSRAVYDASGNPIYLEGAAARNRKPLREFDAKALQFYKRMTDALPRVEEAEAELQGEGGASLIDTFADNFGSAGNFIKSPEYQTYQAAAREWIAGLLRLDSGAAVPDSEFNRYFSTYFFAPGDNEQTRKAKTAARLAAMDALKAIQPPGYGTDGAAPPAAAPSKPITEYSEEELRQMLGE